MVRGIEAPAEGGKKAGYVESGRLGGGQKSEKEEKDQKKGTG